MIFFFFQAEDGIRDDLVTGVQTCALPISDLPWAGVAVRLRVSVRKFFCDNATCLRRICSERLADVAAVSARRTTRQQESLTAIAFALGGEAGARLAGQLGLPISP